MQRVMPCKRGRQPRGYLKNQIAFAERRLVFPLLVAVPAPALGAFFLKILQDLEKQQAREIPHSVERN